MIYGLYQSAAGMMVHEYRQDVLANNIANAETVGFKRQIAMFSQRPQAVEAGVRTGSGDRLLGALTGGVWLAQTQTDFDEGSFVTTGEATDVALAGPGFFVVARDGQEFLTRDGRFTLTPWGQLVSATDGAAVLGMGGAPIQIHPRGGKVMIDEDGWIEQNNARVGRLAVVDVPDRRGLTHAGAGRFFAGNMPTTPAPAHVIAGHVESSGVEPVRELAAMLEATRAYQLNAQMLSLQDQTAGRLISTVAGAA